MFGQAGDGAPRDEEVLSVAGLSKAFDATQALVDVGFTVERSEVHGLLGANGSGKSTLIKILAGVDSADAGTIAVGGESHDAAAWSPALAHDAGLRFVHQSRSAFPGLTVAENLAIGRGFPLGPGRRIRWSALNRHTEQVLERFGIDVHPKTPMSSLGPAVQTTIAIARALQDVGNEGPGMLILDEPTAALPRAEVDLLLESLRRYAAEGEAIVLVTHRLDEALSTCDRITALRDGRVAGTRPAAELNENSLISLMMGRAVDRVYPEAGGAAAGETVLEATGLVGGTLTGASLSLHSGEIVGLAGLLGSGRTELLQTLFGARDPGSGQIRIRGRATSFGGPADAMAADIAYVPEDRTGAAAFLDADIAENLSIARLPEYWSRLRMDRRSERSDAIRSIGAYGIKAPSHRTPLGTLSGGNQQKVILARWLARRPRVLLLDEPTQGVDVGARAEIYRLIRSAADDGCAVLIASSDFEELAHVCDRVLILANGRCERSVSGADDLDGQRLTEEIYATMEVVK